MMIRKLFRSGFVGLIVGALIGGLAFAGLATDSTATAFLRLHNPPDLAAIAGGANQTTPENQDITTGFVGGEITYLSGEGFAQAVAEKMAEDDPIILTVAQAGDSPLITISATSGSRDKAIRIVQTAIDLYGHELAQRVDQQLRTILPALSEWQQRHPADGVRNGEVERLRESVELQAARASRLVVVQPPTPNPPGTHLWLVGAFLGALVGGSAAVALQLVRRRRGGQGAVVRTLTGFVDGVLVPAVDLGLPPRERWGDDQTRLARRLFAQCRSEGPDRLILVIGASESSGSGVVAALFEHAAAADDQPATMVRNRPGQHSSSTAHSPTRVVDGGCPGDATLTSELVTAATEIVLVARLGIDSAPDVSGLSAVIAPSAAPSLAVFTYRHFEARGFLRAKLGARDKRSTQ